MEYKSLEDYTAEDLLILLNKNVDAIVLVDPDIGKYRAIARREFSWIYWGKQAITKIL